MPESTKKFPIKITEERVIKRITLAGVFADVISGFNIERGLIFTIKLLFSRPGYLLRYYFYEGRYRVFNNFRLLILTTAASVLAMYTIAPEDFLLAFGEGYNSVDGSSQVDMKAYEDWIMDWYNLILWTAIPIYALFSYLFNRKAGFNYAEHMVMQSFHISALNIISLVFVIITALTSQEWMILILLLVAVAYYFWMLINWFEKRSFGFILKNLMGYVLANIVYILGVGIAVAMVFLT